MKWIKASERLWEYGKPVIVRYEDSVSVERAHNITWCLPIDEIFWLDESSTSVEELKKIREAFQWTFDNMGTPHTSDHFNIPANGLTAIDELIESASLPSSSVTGEESWKEVIINRISEFQKIYHANEAGRLTLALKAIEELIPPSYFESLPVTGESEAIGMIKWIRENYEPEFGDGRHWEDILDEAETPISDKELYNLYKQSKK